MLTGGEHALHKVAYVAEYNPEALWTSLLPHQGFDLDALQYRLRHSIIGSFGVEDCTEPCKYLE